MSSNTDLWEGAQCSKNRYHQKPYYYCMRCDKMVCRDCWFEIGRHRGQEPGHDKTRPNDAIIVHSVLKVRLGERPLLENAISRCRAPYLRQIDDNTEWFGVWRKNEAGDYSLVEGHAYNLIADSFRTSKADIYPCLVSFVGETGSGKSTLIGLLSKFSHNASGNLFKTPVVGDLGSRQSTSSNVHLYADPQTYLDERPILYAECEGIDEYEILAEMKKPLAGASASSDPLPPHGSQIPELGSQDIVWSKILRHAGARARKDITRITFPRVLYIFSHVVVFPFSGPTGRLVDPVLRLVQWGHDATIHSYNKPDLPSAIIVFRADPDDYHLSTPTQSFFEARQDVSKDKTLRPYIEYWKTYGQHIISAKDLLSCYYSSVSVVHLPSCQSPTAMCHQLGELRGRITEMCSGSQWRRDEKSMSWNAATLPLFVRKALTHFASKYETPFNFSDAWVDLQNFTPNFTWSIFNLARIVRGHRDVPHVGMDLWVDISAFVASCVFLKSVRTKQVDYGLLDEAQKQYTGAMKQYWMKLWPCDYRIETPEGYQQCVNAPSGHPHHQGGKAVARGDHSTSDLLPRLQINFHYLVKMVFADLMSRHEQYSDSQERLQEASAIHLMRTRNLYQSIKGIDKLVSRLHCLVCLDGVPEQSLPCGHVICRECAKAAGDSSAGRFVTLQDCPLQDHRKEDWPRGLAEYDKFSRGTLSVDGYGPGKVSRGFWKWKR